MITKRSTLFVKTQKNAPADEVSKNAQLLIRAGYVHKEMAGAYVYLPLGLRVFNKIVEIIRQEMNAIGGNELFMTALQRPEPWEASGRWSEDVVDVWFKTKLATGQVLGLANTHEEAITDMMRSHIRSYKDLPVYAYQFQTKFRNELRSKSGIMRGREFIMKDLYSFSINKEAHDAFYERCKQAYLNVFQRVGIGDKTFVTFASGGSFSKFSHEFQTICDAGEDEVFLDEATGDYLNREVVSAKVGQANVVDTPLPLQEHELHGVIGVEALIKHFNIPIQKSTKALYFDTDTGDTVLAVLRSDYSIDERKLADVCGAATVTLTPADKIKKLTGADIGYAGLLNVPESVRVVVDDSLNGATNFETGSNKTGYHAVNVNFGRDVPAPSEFADIKVAQKGDINPATGKAFPVFKAAEVGNIFTLGTKYSQALGLTFTDEQGKQQPVFMGSYGIGPGRTMGVVVESLADDKGLVWPAAIAPYHVCVVSIGDVGEQAQAVADQLDAAGIDVLYDDRSERPGEKFADADLMGIPVRVVVSERTLKNNVYEVKLRTSDDPQELPADALVAFVQSQIQAS